MAAWSSSFCGSSCVGAWLILVTSTLFRLAEADQSTLPSSSKLLAYEYTASMPWSLVLAALEKMLMPVLVTVGSSTLPLALIAATTAGAFTAPPEPYSAPLPTMRSSILI
jgi:hypothetical protein